MNWLKNRPNQIFLVILSAIIFLLFWRLGRPDVLGDDSPYAIRSIGLVDYMFSDRQTTPLQWFNPFPAWAYWSFHDAPPVYFLTQHLFFKLFGVSTVISRLPSALAGVLIAWLIYAIIRLKLGYKEALVGLGSLLALTPFMWLQRLGYPESLMMLFVVASVYFFLKAEKNPRNYLWWGGVVGLAIGTKYTAFFLFPAYLTYLLIINRQAFRKLYLWLGGAISLVIFSPVIIYNIMMFKTRGHFDVQFAALFKQPHDDWVGLSTAVNPDLWQSMVAITQTLGNLVGWPMLCLWVVLIGVGVYSFFKKQQRPLNLLVLLLMLFWFIILVFTKPHVWFVATGYFIFPLMLASSVNFFSFIKYRLLTILATSVVVVILGYSFIFSLNTNQAIEPIGQPKLTYSQFRIKSVGYNQLEKFMAERIKGKQPLYILGSDDEETLDQQYFNRKIYNMNRPPDDNSIFSREVFIYNENISWFAELWYFKRLFFYQRYDVFSTRELAALRDNQPESFATLVSNAENVYYFQPTENTAMDEPKYQQPIDVGIEKKLTSGEIIKEITGPEGQVYFKIYRLTAEQTN